MRGDEATFVALPDGTLLVEDGGGDLAPLAGAVEQSVAPPYRAHAVRKGETVWAVAANRIEVRRLDRLGDEIEEVEDGMVVRARRLDGDLWEVEATPL